jgi:hypothetical protein
MQMTKAFFPLLAATAGAVVLLTAAPNARVKAEDQPAVELIPHRAVYDLKLMRSRGNRGLEAVRGRILYDFSGSACEGYALQFRQVSELDSGEGKSAISDLRATTWEDASAKTFRFSSQNLLNQQPVDTVDGSAERTTGAVAVSLKKPQDKSFDVIAGAVFPTEHMRRIITAARAGQTLLELPVYDGSETGEKLYNTLTVIGKPIPPDEKKPTDAAAEHPELANLTRWPVTISYFEKKEKEDTGEQTPVYAITFELYDNGISRALTLDYNDFVLSGEMTSIEIKKPKPCP